MSDKLQLAWSGRNVSKIPPFEQGDFSLWWENFDLACKMDQLKSEERKDFLFLALGMEVRKEIKALKWDGLEYSKLVDCLKQRFEVPCDENMLAVKLVNISKDPSKTHVEYASQIKQLAASSSQQEVSEVILLALFTNGLQSEELRELVDREKPKSLWDAAKLCDKRVLSHPQQHCAATRGADRVMNLERKVEELADMIGKLSMRSPGPRCFNCGKFGHMAKNCRIRRNFRVGNMGNLQRSGTAFTKARVNGIYTDCLIDTGSEVSLIRVDSK
ncbi:hypothetical protein RF11_15247 [Thelohanellus kitauei]|uniref:CCHC-type domain-containing protein n=1 Tax=Thelohanellus kitauei TaxID=669202 RepID=A0A0C2MI55_THEKT|nr:hypothetical protein RF11_15247 [Thelohanellus kitauei]